MALAPLPRADATLFIVGLIAIEAVRLRRALREKALTRRIDYRQEEPQ